MFRVLSQKSRLGLNVATVREALVAELGATVEVVYEKGCDADSVELPGVQRQLVEQMLATGKPVILVLLTGRPYAVGWAIERCAAVVQSCFPRQEGAQAIVGVLSGRINPSGRLPVSDRRMVRVVKPGLVDVSAGACCAELALTESITLTGEVYEVGIQDHRQIGVSIRRFAVSNPVGRGPSKPNLTTRTSPGAPRGAAVVTSDDRVRGEQP